MEQLLAGSFFGRCPGLMDASVPVFMMLQWPIYGNKNIKSQLSIYKPEYVACKWPLYTQQDKGPKSGSDFARIQNQLQCVDKKTAVAHAGGGSIRSAHLQRNCEFARQGAYGGVQHRFKPVRANFNHYMFTSVGL